MTRKLLSNASTSMSKSNQGTSEQVWGSNSDIGIKHCFSLWQLQIGTQLPLAISILLELRKSTKLRHLRLALCHITGHNDSLCPTLIKVTINILTVTYKCFYLTWMCRVQMFDSLECTQRPQMDPWRPASWRYSPTDSMNLTMLIGCCSLSSLGLTQRGCPR